MVNGATNWHDAIENAINATLSVAKELQPKSGFIAASIANLPPSTKETCKESFQTTTDMLEEGLDHLAAGDNGSLHTKLSAALDIECADELSNLGVATPLTNMAEDLHKKVSVCLAIMTQNANVTT
ncbi:PMEI domain-containing protein [Abeliophyllum distichum]